MGHYFDSPGRRAIISALLLVATDALFVADTLTATGRTVAWAVIFFFATATARSAYLTINEIFPIELRTLAIAVVYACITGAGGIVASTASSIHC